MTLYECPVCFHVQHIAHTCNLCGRKAKLVEVPDKAMIKAKCAAIQAQWTSAEEQSHSAYRQAPYELQQMPSCGKRVNRRRPRD